MQRTGVLTHKQGVTTPTDADLLRSSRRDPHAFGVLYERHARPIAAFLARRVGGPVAEDLLAEVFTAGFTARMRVVPHESGSALPWLYGIAHNVVRAHLRRRSGTAVVELHQSVDWAAVDDRLDAGARRSELRAALHSLPPGERDLLLLVAWEGLSPSEAGRALGLTPTAARSRLHRARLRAQSSLDSLERT